MTKQLDRTQFKVASGQASEKDMADIGRESVWQIKANPKLVQVRCKAAEVEDLGDRVLRHVISADSVDRMGDRINQRGWDFGNFKANPVVLWAHDGDANLPIGRGVNLFQREVGGEVQTVLDTEYVPKSMNEFADSVYEYSKAGFLTASSVGFLPQQVREYDSDEAREKDGLGDFGVFFEKQELLENSRVSVPAHPGAVGAGLKSLVADGRLDAAQAERFKAAAQVTERDWLKRWERLLRIDWLHSAMRGKAVPAAQEQRPVLSMDDLGELLEEVRAVRAEMEGARKELAALRFIATPEEVRVDDAVAREQVAALVSEAFGDLTHRHGQPKEQSQ